MVKIKWDTNYWIKEPIKEKTKRFGRYIVEKTTSFGESTGTSLQGYVNSTYANIVRRLGEPSGNGDGYKVDAEWILKVREIGSDGLVRSLFPMTIYNYKDGRNYSGEEGLYVEDITEWHIGGRDEEVKKVAKEIFTFGVID